MEFEDALFEWVATQSTITALIGAPPAAVRFFKLRIENGAKLPAIVQQRSGTSRQSLQCAVDGAVSISLQVDFYAPTWKAMKEAARAFRLALRPGNVTYPFYMGEGDSPSVGVKVKAATLETEFDGEDPDPGLARRTQLWTFWVWEP